MDPENVYSQRMPSVSEAREAASYEPYSQDTYEPFERESVNPDYDKYSSTRAARDRSYWSREMETMVGKAEQLNKLLKTRYDRHQDAVEGRFRPDNFENLTQEEIG